MEVDLIGDLSNMIQHNCCAFTFALNKKRGIQNEEKNCFWVPENRCGYDIFRFLKYRYCNAVVSVCGQVLGIRISCTSAIESHNETTAIASPTLSSLAFLFCHLVGWFVTSMSDAGKIQDFHMRNLKNRYTKKSQFLQKSFFRISKS